MIIRGHVLLGNHVLPGNFWLFRNIVPPTSQVFLFTYDIYISIDPINNMKLLNANYEPPKAPIFIPYIFEEKQWMNN